MWVRILAARICVRALCEPPSKRIEGAGKTGCRLTPAARLQQKKAGGSHHRLNRRHPAFPAQWFHSLFRALPGVRDLIVTVMSESSPAHLAPAQGRQDHTTSPYALPSLVWRRQNVHRIPHPTFVTTRTPLIPDRNERTIVLIFVICQAAFCAAGLDIRSTIELSHEIRFCPPADVGRQSPRERSGNSRFDPTGKSVDNARGVYSRAVRR